MPLSGDGTVFRRLGPDEGAALTSAIVAAYGSTYDLPWVYDADEVNADSPTAGTCPSSWKRSAATCCATWG